MNFQSILPLSIPNINIIGIDPGTDKLGFSCITYDLINKKISSTCATTIIASKCIRYDPHVDVHGERARRLSVIEQCLYNYYKIFNANFVVCEHPFYNNSRPSAFEPLVESIAAVRKSLFLYDPAMLVMAVDPPTAKKAIGAGGAAKKDDMQRALKNIEHSLAFNPLVFGVPFDLLDEHSVDSIAVAMSFVNKL